MRIIAFVFLSLLQFGSAIANPKDTLPTPPGNVRCGDGKDGYGLYWIDKSDNENQFKVYGSINKLDGHKLISKITSTSPVTVGTVYFYKIDDIPENFYSYTVTSVSKAGESASSNVTILPKRPDGLSATADSLSVSLHWTYPSESWIKLLFVERSKSPDSGFQIMSPIVSQNGINYVDYSPDRGVDYYYRIRGAYYDSKAKVTSYTKPTNTIGPYRISGIGKDYDGEINYQGQNYRYKSFGRQTWMIDNLAWLPEVYPSGSTSDSIRRYYVYGYEGSDVSAAKNTENYKRYGVLYNLPAAGDGFEISASDTIGMQGICPAGWHLPSNYEWMALRGNLDKARALRDSAFRRDAINKNVAGGSAQPLNVDFALPEFREFNAVRAGRVHRDSNKFLSAGEVENYWSATSRIVFDRGYKPSESGKGFGYPVRCLKGAALPLVKTGAVTEIAKTTARPGGFILADGGVPVTETGVIWSTLDSSNIGINKTSCGTDQVAFNCSLTGLLSGTIYFVRAYATNSIGTVYGEMKQFITAGEGALPVAVTGDITDVLGVTAAIGGSFTSYGGAPVTSRGICWNTKKSPTISNNITASVSGSIEFTGYLAGLTAQTTYYVRAFATNSFGTAYGAEKKFTTTEEAKGGSFDFAGSTYPYKTIGNQIWMTENLAYLPDLSLSTDESNEKPKYYVYGYAGANVDSAKATENYKTYGVLYNWSAAAISCPSGWHLPTEAEIAVLTNYLINYGYSFKGQGATIAKSMASNSGWTLSPMPGTIGEDQATNNRSGFNVRPGGQRSLNGAKKVIDIGRMGILWLSSAYGREGKYAYSLALFYSNNIAQPYPTDKKQGFSVRCIKDK